MRMIAASILAVAGAVLVLAANGIRSNPPLAFGGSVLLIGGVAVFVKDSGFWDAVSRWVKRVSRL